MSKEEPNLINQHIDLAALRQLQNILGDEFWPLCNSFKDNASAAIAHMEQSAFDGDMQTLKQTAHSVKGMAMNMYAPELVRQCRQLEEQAHALSYTETMNQLSTLRIEVLTVIGEMNRLKIPQANPSTD